jgi:hypothetical protein
MQHEPRKIALFVDFDNIYLGLRETSREAAEAFATRPHAWLKWIEHGMPIGDVEHVAPRESRALIRQCYLNPDSFGKYRGYFTRAGFTVVDCPSLTSRGKNSSDIVMVMDILDALRHETRFDRFVIMSADADFTPVLQRLRAHDRRTAVMVSGLAAPAYRASCDKLIEEDVFIEHALELPSTPEPSRAAAPAASAPQPSVTAIRDPELLAAIGRRVYEEASSSGMLPASELPRILREFKEFTPTSNWLGYYSLQALTEAVLEHRPELRITDDDPWRIAVQGADEPAAAPAAAPGAPPPAGDADWEAVRDRVVGLVERLVAESADPVVMGKAAHAAILEIGPRLTESRWLGRGTFKNLLLSARELPFRVVASPLPGYVFDPERHQPPSDRAAVDGLAELGTEMASLIRRISQLTDAPKLMPRQYRVMWEVIAKELGRAPYNLMGTGKAVRDQCVERGEPIARQAITWVLRGLGYVGYHFEAPAHRAEDLAAAYRGNLLTILRQAQVTLSDDELRMLDDWLLAPPSDAAPPAEPARPSPRSRRVAPADPDAVTEPDYAAWADALLAGASAAERPSAPPEPDAAQPEAPAPPPAEPEPFEWPPRDALRFEEEERAWLREQGTPPSIETLFSEPAEEERGDPRSNGEAEGAEPTAAPDAPSADAPPSDAPADAPPQPVNEMQPGENSPSDDQPAQPAIEGDAQPGDVVSAEWQLSTDAAPADALPAEPAREGGAPQPDVVSADWQMAEDQAASSDAAPNSTPSNGRPDSTSSDAINDAAPSDADSGTTPSDASPDAPPSDATNEEASAGAADAADAQPAVEAPHGGDAPPADIVSAEWQMADWHPADATAPEGEQPPSTEALPLDPPYAEPPADGEIVTADWQPAADPPPPAVGDPPVTETPPSPAADPPVPDPPHAGPPSDGEVVDATWQAEDAASSEPAQPASADAAPQPSSATEPPPGDVLAAAWEPVSADPPAAEPEPAAPAPEAAQQDAPAPEPADDIMTPQWEPVTNAGRRDDPSASPDAPTTQMDAFPPDSRQGEQPEQVPAELSAAPDAAPRQDDPPQKPQGWQ